MSDKEEGRQHGTKARRMSLVLEGQDVDAGRWAQGIKDVGFQGVKPGSKIGLDLGFVPPLSAETPAQQDGTITNLMPSVSGDRRNSDSSAATMLMAANTFAQIPPQSVGDALLDKVQMVAAKEQSRRRNSRLDSSLDEIVSNSATVQEERYISTIPSIDVQLAGQQSSTSSSSPSFNNQMTTSIEAMPSTLAADVHVSNIATVVAAKEYIKQGHLLGAANNGDVHTSPAPNSHLPQPSHSGSLLSLRQWDDKSPFQGVPSLPLTPTASLAMLPPVDLTTNMPTPLTPAGSSTSLPFMPIYRLAAHEYQILASAAAIATVAFTTAGTNDSSSSLAINKDSHSSSIMSNDHTTTVEGQEIWTRRLTKEEQEQIAAILRAWAGLEGVERQQEARRILQDRQQQLNSNDKSNDDLQFFPPDFARHYKSQLTALAAGYYQKLHSDGLIGSQYALEGILEEQIGMKAMQSQALEDNDQQKAKANAREHVKGLTPTHQAEEILSNKEKQGTLATPTNPMQLITNASTATGFDATSPEIRDHLLQYAHNLYSTGSTTVTVGSIKKGMTTNQQQEMHPTLLPLLHTLHDLHPSHLPTLLLLSCAYYSKGDLAASLWYNKVILEIDEKYVESMSNIGTTLRALNRSKEAESWWWKAIKIRPGYWDAYENLLGVLCSTHQSDAKEEESRIERRDRQGKENRVEEKGPRFKDALRLCEYVESHVLAKRQDEDGSNRPISMPSTLPFSQATRLQNLLYAKGNLNYVLPEHGSLGAAKEYEKAVEIMLSSSERNACSVRDLVMATYVVAILTLGVGIPEAASTNATAKIAQALGLEPTNPHHAQLAATGQYSSLRSGGVLEMVRDAGDRLVDIFLDLAGGHLPMLMLLPESAIRLCSMIFSETQGALPGIVSSYHAQKAASASTTSLQQTLQQASSMTSTIILTLSKVFQDDIGTVVAGSKGRLTLGGIPASTSLLLPFYYLSLALNPSASTANNLGILLSSIPSVASVMNSSGQRQLMNGQSMALQYYTYGLQLDSKHPHLYTNFGSLLKDLNRLNEAIQMYERAIQCKPDFDVALANLGNAIKDQGRTQDSIQYYRKAVQMNSNFPEALCGLVNALLAVCDWKEVYGDDDVQGESGYMKSIRTLLDKQLEEGIVYGRGVLSAEKSLDDWIEVISKSTGDTREGCKDELRLRLSPFFDDGFDRKGYKINEGSFIIRFIERLMRQTQRRWYHDVFVEGKSTERILAQQGDIERYARIPLPSCLVNPSVPTVLPFHTFTLKISPRHIRLISHRNALRISQSTMNQLWLPRHVYPPPIPPRPKIKVGYISSDFNNHPLAHLMQSVFGFHNKDEFDVHLYATTSSDQSPYRLKIEKGAHHFLDVSTLSNQNIIKKILEDGIHILMNLNGYTKGAKNEIFAARPCPVQMEFMGFAGGLASGWTDWIVADPIVCPPEMTSCDVWRAKRNDHSSLKPTDWKGNLDPEEESNEWIYTEKFIYMPDSYFVNDHRQGFREPKERQSIDGTEMTDEEAWKEEEEKRWKARKEMWPNLPDDYIIFSDFNQLYKLEPCLFKLWLRILGKVPNSILWLLKFPAAGENNLIQYARDHFGEAVASRVIFTEVAPKAIHIHRGRIADLFLDTLECGAHTTSADILWSATPVLTWPRHEYKMASRVAASIVNATGFGKEMIVNSEKEYEDRAVELAKGLHYTYIDEKGNVLVPEKRSGTIQADALEVNSLCTSATPHNSNNKAGQSSAVSASSQTSIPGAASNPGPANVKQVAANSLHDSITSTNGSSSTNSRPKLDRRKITLTVLDGGHFAPKGTVSRRAHGTLATLRRQLFLSRDRNKLFDTKLWVKNLERGYKEAWKRFVDGTDVEDSKEWEELSEEDGRKKSGHIWL